MRLEVDHIYLIRLSDGDIVKAQYVGRQRGFECVVCGKGSNAYTFNIWYQNGKYADYETWGFGANHMPEILRELDPEDYIND